MTWSQSRLHDTCSASSRVSHSAPSVSRSSTSARRTLRPAATLLSALLGATTEAHLAGGLRVHATRVTAGTPSSNGRSPADILPTPTQRPQVHGSGPHDESLRVAAHHDSHW